MISIRLSGVQQTRALLQATAVEVDRAARNAANRTAAQIKRRLVPELARPTGVLPKIVRAALRIRRASNDRPVAVLKPSGRGIPVKLYRWKPERRNRDELRSRIFVAWVDGGWKLAAGFANPSAADFQPDALSTLRDNRSAAQRAARLRGKNKHGTHRVQALDVPIDATGPSVAAMWRALDIDGRTDRYSEMFAIEFDRSLAAQLAKRR